MEMEFKTLSGAQAFGKIGTANDKMPGSSFAISPSKCHVGAKLADVKGSVCHACYALRIEKFRTSARVGWGNNFERSTRLIAEAPEKWANALAFQVRWHCKKLGEPFHRWFDAGDLQSVEMLSAIARVAELTPEIKHWLPTREAGIVKQWRANGGVEPSNLVIRISSTMVDDAPRNAPHTSTVHSKGARVFGHECPSHTPENRAYSPKGGPNCGACRACWDKAVANVSYGLH